MRKYIILSFVLIGGFLIMVKSINTPINCAVSAENPYNNLPMVCKVVLKAPK